LAGNCAKKLKQQWKKELAKNYLLCCWNIHWESTTYSIKWHGEPYILKLECNRKVPLWVQINQLNIFRYHAQWQLCEFYTKWCKAIRELNFWKINTYIILYISVGCFRIFEKMITYLVDIIYENIK
jgi:hypothetical protein